MRAAVVRSLDGPRSVQVEDRPEPEAAQGQVLVDVRRAGVAYPDVLLTRGEYQIKPELPFVPGAEVSGTVRHDPSGTHQPGTRVAAFPGFGGFAEQVAVGLPAVFALPDHLDDDAAAALPMNYLTCLFALEHRGRLRAGETVLVHGASGGIGTAALQLASALGAHTIAVVSDAARAEVARAAGADEVVTADGFRDQVKDLTAGAGVDMVIDPVGADRFTDSLRSLAVDGRLMVVGFTGGSIPEVKVNRLLLNNISVMGVGWGAYWLHRPDYLAGQWNRLLELWTEKQFTPPIGARFGLDEVAEAIATLDERRATGKVILQISDPVG